MASSPRTIPAQAAFGIHFFASQGGMIEYWRMIPRHRMLSHAMQVLVICLCTPHAYAADQNLESYRDLKAISLFDSISVSVHNTDPEKAESGTGFSPEELTQYLRLQFANNFPDVPYRSMDASEQANPETGSSRGRLLCRIWVDGENSPTVFQVRCQISTSTHVNIIDDVSFGYGPKEKAPAIVREQIDQILKGFALIFFRVRNEL